MSTTALPPKHRVKQYEPKRKYDHDSQSIQSNELSFQNTTQSHIFYYDDYQHESGRPSITEQRTKLMNSKSNDNF